MAKCTIWEDKFPMCVMHRPICIDLKNKIIRLFHFCIDVDRLVVSLTKHTQTVNAHINLCDKHDGLWTSAILAAVNACALPSLNEYDE